MAKKENVGDDDPLYYMWEFQAETWCGRRINSDISVVATNSADAMLEAVAEVERKRNWCAITDEMDICSMVRTKKVLVVK